MEHYAPRVFGLQLEHLVQMPCYSLSLAVLIGSEPHGFGFRCRLAQLCHELGLIVRDLIYGAEVVVDIYAETFLFQVANVAVARHDAIIVTEEFLYSLGLGRRLDDDKVFRRAHSAVLFFSNDKISENILLR